MQPTLDKSPRETIRTVSIILGSIWVGLLFYNILVQISGFLTVHNFRPDLISRTYYMTLKIWVPWLLLSPIVVVLAHRFPVRPENWISRALLHMLLLLLLSLVAGSALSFHYHFREEMSEVMKTYLPWQHVGHFLFGDSLFLYNAIIYTVFIASFNIRNFHELARASELDSARLTSQLNQAKLHALKMQVNPHFLFNTLNAISVLVLKGDSTRAGEMIQRLSDFFRSSLEETDQHWICVSDELNTIEKYVAIEQVRFGDRLSFKTQFEPDAMTILIPAMILQPLVENAIQHGLSNLEAGGVLLITTRVRHTKLLITIVDNGDGIAPKREHSNEHGIGIRNVRQRLQQSYGGDFEFSVEQRSEGGTIAKMVLPAMTEPPQPGEIRL